MKPNVFNYDTSGSAQDAVLCWMAAWADPRTAQYDPLLHDLGMSFLTTLFQKHHRPMPEIRSGIDIQTRRHGIDILVTIDGRLVICIETRAATTEHTERLERYVAALRAKGYAPDHILSVYVQTGEQANYDAARRAEYPVVERRDLLDILQTYRRKGGSSRAIACDFLDYLTKLDTRVNAFRHVSPADWDDDEWRGFFSELQRVLGEGGWGYVPRGEYWAFWWHWVPIDQYGLYIQVHRGELCFRIEMHDRIEGRRLQDEWGELILRAAEKMGVRVQKPTRPREGDMMRAAALESDYRVVDARGRLDLPATVEILRQAEKILDRAVKAYKVAG